MESISRSRFIRISPRKLKLVCELIAGKKVDHALSILEFTPKKAARFVSKTLLAAVANARDLVREPPVESHAVGMADGQQPAAHAHTRAAARS